MAGRPVTDPIIERLRQRRLDLGLSLYMVGRAVGVTRKAVWMWERGDRSPDVEMLRRWTTALALDLAVLDFAPRIRRPHGTYAAARRHRYHRESPCGPCAAAERNYWALRARRRRLSTGSPQQCPQEGRLQSTGDTAQPAAEEAA